MAKKSLLALVVFALSGCNGIDHAQIDGVTNMPDDSRFTIQGATMHTGIATAFKPRLWTHDATDTDEEDRSSIDVQSSNNSVIGIANVTDDDRVVVYAVGPGQATVTITFNGAPAQVIPVTVTDPPQ
jgi:hypothetical protein